MMIALVPVLCCHLLAELPSVLGVLEATYRGSVFEPNPPGHCSRGLGEGTWEISVSLPACAAWCEQNHCWRFLYCPHTQLCAFTETANNLTGCVCHKKKKICQSGGKLDASENCECQKGYHGTECEHVIKDCTEGWELGLGFGNEISWVRPTVSGPAFQVLCDFDYGFTFILNRRGWCARQNFNRTWQEYRTGFGDLNCNHWLGLDNIHRLTYTGVHSLEVNVDVYDDWGQGFYCPFSVSGPESDFAITLSNFTNPTPDMLFDAFRLPNGKNIDGKPFATFDHDSLGTGCPQLTASGFWFDTYCTAGNLNGPYVTAAEIQANSAVRRMTWAGPFDGRAIQHAIMRIKRAPEC